MSEGYRRFDHTADLGLEVWAETPERLHALAAEAVLTQVAEPRDGIGETNADVELEVDLEGEDPADLLVHWLNTALLEAEVRRVVWVRAQVRELTPTRLVGGLSGERLDPSRHVLMREIKAVSHHHLELSLDPPECRCRLVLDL